MTFTVFLDRDGVFNHHPKFAVRRPKDLHLLPGVVEAFATLHVPKVQTALVTNQPTVGLGLSSPSRIRKVNEHLREVLTVGGGRLDQIQAAYAFFPHRRRKPNPGMLEDAAKKFADRGKPVDKTKAVMIGDKPKDAAAGTHFGIPTILLATTYDRERLEKESMSYDVAAIVDGLPEALEIVGRWIKRGSTHGT